jgi:hypothetical protein
MFVKTVHIVISKFVSDRTKNADPKAIHRSRVWLDSYVVALRSDPTALPTLGDEHSAKVSGHDR